MMKINKLNSNAKSEVKEFTFFIITNTFLMISVCSLVFAFVLSQQKIALGIIAGGILSIINFYLMSRSANQLLKAEDEKDGKKSVVGGFYIRYILIIFALLCLFSVTNVNVISTLISLFSVQLVIFITQLWETRKA